MIVYDTIWPSDVHGRPNKCKQVTELYLQKERKRVIKNEGSLGTSSVDFT